MSNRLSAVLIGGIAAIAFAQLASAADLPRKAPVYTPPPPPVLGWTGFYAGLNAGYHWSNSSVDTVGTPGPFDVANAFGADSVAAAQSATSSINAKQNGFIGGGQIGYNWQFAPNWVTGIEADIQGIAHNNGTASATSVVKAVGFPDTFATTTMVSRQVDWLGTVRGRLGVLATPSLLVYGTGGLAYGEAKATTAINQTGSFIFALPPIPYSTIGSFSETRAGWTLGGGLEWMFAPHWTLKAEYLYYDLGHETFALPLLSPGQPPGCAANPCWSANVQSTTHFNGNIVRAGINYLFN